jgi:hypothetical protein
MMERSANVKCLSLARRGVGRTIALHLAREALTSRSPGAASSFVPK